MIETLTNPHNVAAVLIAIAVAATIVTVAQPFLWTDRLDKRMKSVASERERIRRREREKMAVQKANLKFEPKAYMKQVVDNLNLSTWLGTEQAKAKMASAGFRGSGAETAFLFFRLVTPIVLVAVAALYIFVILAVTWPLMLRFVAVMAAAYIGIKAPEFYISNVIAKRYKSISRAFPDAMDLLLICVESGMSIEQAFRKVGVEIGVQSIPLAEELTLTTAELSYLPERRTAYENLANRVKTESVKQIATVLIQAERYGTPLGSALRVLGQESRDHRMLLAEQKAAALPPKLTVPMIIFFLPVLFAVILTPAIIQITTTFGG